MKKFFCSLMFAAMTMMTVVAQDTPALITINVEEFVYKPTKTTIALSVLSVVADTKDLWLPDNSMVPQMNESIVAGTMG